MPWDPDYFGGDYGETRKDRERQVRLEKERERSRELERERNREINRESKNEDRCNCEECTRMRNRY